jgi:hypothetical protein
LELLHAFAPSQERRALEVRSREGMAEVEQLRLDLLLEELSLEEGLDVEEPSQVGQAFLE